MRLCIHEAVKLGLLAKVNDAVGHFSGFPFTQAWHTACLD